MERNVHDVPRPWQTSEKRGAADLWRPETSSKKYCHTAFFQNHCLYPAQLSSRFQLQFSHTVWQTRSCCLKDQPRGIQVDLYGFRLARYSSLSMDPYDLDSVCTCCRPGVEVEQLGAGRNLSMKNWTAYRVALLALPSSTRNVACLDLRPFSLGDCSLIQFPEQCLFDFGNEWWSFREN